MTTRFLLLDEVTFLFLELAHLSVLKTAHYAYKIGAYSEGFILVMTAIISCITHACWSSWQLCLFGVVNGRTWRYFDIVFSYMSVGVIMIYTSKIKQKLLAYVIVFTYSMFSVAFLDGERFFYDRSICTGNDPEIGFPLGIVIGIIILIVLSYLLKIPRKPVYWFGVAFLFFIVSGFVEIVWLYNVVHGLWHLFAFYSAYYFLQVEDSPDVNLDEISI